MQELASARRAAPLPGGGRTPWVASKGFRLHRHSPFQDFSCRKGGLREAAIWWPAGSARLPVALYPSCRHRQPPPRRIQRCRGHFQIEGLSRQAAATGQGDDARHRRVHPPLPDPRRCPAGFHRIRHYGLFASAARRENLARARQLLGVPQPTTQDAADSDAAPEPWRRCPCCGGSMIIVEVLARTIQPRTPPATAAPPARAPP